MHADHCRPALMRPDRLLNNWVTLHVSARPVPFSKPTDAVDSALQMGTSITYHGEDGSCTHTKKLAKES